MSQSEEISDLNFIEFLRKIFRYLSHAIFLLISTHIATDIKAACCNKLYDFARETIVRHQKWFWVAQRGIKLLRRLAWTNTTV